MKTKIFLTCFAYKWRSYEDVIGYALGEDGQGLASHLSSDVDWAKHDMGLTSDWKHEHYSKVYPDGYELIWINNPDDNELWQKALTLNQAGKETNLPEE